MGGSIETAKENAEAAGGFYQIEYLEIIDYVDNMVIDIPDVE